MCIVVVDGKTRELSYHRSGAGDKITTHRRYCCPGKTMKISPTMSTMSMITASQSFSPAAATAVAPLLLLNNLETSHNSDLMCSRRMSTTPNKITLIKRRWQTIQPCNITYIIKYDEAKPPSLFLTFAT